jgi:hypothetical protein
VALADCKDAIVKALGGVASDREVASITRAAKALKERIDASNADPMTFLEDHLAREKAARVLAQRDAYNNYLAERRFTEWRKSDPFIHNNPKTAMLAKLINVNTDIPGAKDGVASRMDRASEAASGAMWTELEAAKLHKIARDGTLDKEVGGAIWDIQHGQAAGLDAKYGTAAAKLAKIMVDHKQSTVQNYNDAGGHIVPLPEHIVSRMYDGNKVAKSGGNAWGSEASQNHFIAKAMKMDWSKSFDGELLNATPEARKEAIHNIYTNIVSGFHPNFESDKLVGRGFGNLAKRGSYQRDIVFSNAADETDWLKTYGRGNSLAETQDYAMHRSYADAELIRRFGPNVKQTWNAALDKWYGDLSKEGNVASAQKLVDARKYVDRYIWPGLINDSGVPTGNPVAIFLGALRSTTMIAAKVGASLVSNIGDIPAKAAGGRYWSDQSAGKFVGDLAKTTKTIFHDGMSEAEKRQVAIYAGIRIQDVLRPMGPMMEDQLGLGRTARWAQNVLKYSSHSWWGNRLHTNAAVATGFDHARLMDKDASQLSATTKREFSQFGISDAEWNVIRQAEPSEFGGYKSLQKIDIDQMPLEKFKGLAGEGASDKQLEKTRQEVSDKYRNMVGERSIEGTAYPTRALKTAMTFGTRAGTMEGELLRNAFALKNFIYGFTKNTLGRELFGYERQPDGTFDVPRAIWNTLTKRGNGGGRAGLAMLLSASVGYGYVRDWLSDTISGKSIEDPFTARAFQRALAFQALGIYGDFLFDQVRKNSNQPEHMSDRVLDAMGPGIGTVADIGNIFVDGAAASVSKHGLDDREIGKLSQRLFGTVYRTVPGNNVYWAKYAMDYMFYNNLSEMMNPGYQQRLEKNLEKHGQHYFVPPGPQTAPQ